MHCLPCSSFYWGYFQFPCHLGSHVPASKVDLVCAILLFVPTMVWLLMLGISDMHKDLINLCDCTPGLYKRCNSLLWSWHGEKSLAAYGSWTCVSSMLDLMPNQATSPPSLFLSASFESGLTLALICNKDYLVHLCQLRCHPFSHQCCLSHLSLHNLHTENNTKIKFWMG